MGFAPTAPPGAPASQAVTGVSEQRSASTGMSYNPTHSPTATPQPAAMGQHARPGPRHSSPRREPLSTREVLLLGTGPRAPKCLSLPCQA